MNKLFLLFALLLSSISFQVNAVESGNCNPNNDTADCGKPTSYILTMKKLELCTGAPNTDVHDVTCTGAVTVGTGSLVFDVMSVTAGQAIATFASTTGLPIGTTFTHMKPTLSREIKIQGSAIVTGSGFDDFTCYTDSTATLNGANKYERYLAGKTSGTATLMSYYLNSDSGSNASGTSQNAANKMKMCTNKACTSTYNWTSSIKEIPAGGDYGISVEDVTNAEDDFSVLYELQNPYTVSETAPKIDIAFGGALALNVITSNGSTCAISPYYIKTKISISD